MLVIRKNHLTGDIYPYIMPHTFCGGAEKRRDAENASE